MVLESVADEHENGFPEHVEKRTEVDDHQLEEGQDVFLDKRMEKDTPQQCEAAMTSQY